MRPRVEDLARSLQECILRRDAAEALRLHACMHQHGLLSLPSLANPLVVALAQSGSIPLAQQAFDRLDRPNASSFNSLITAYVKQACTSLRDLDHGCEVHSHIARRGHLDTNLVPAYVTQAGVRFLDRDVVLWSTLIGAYAEEGLACNSIGATQDIHFNITKNGYAECGQDYVLSRLGVRQPILAVHPTPITLQNKCGVLLDYCQVTIRNLKSAGDSLQARVRSPTQHPESALPPPIMIANHFMASQRSEY
ncbi:hypothetical protein GOP47_0030134 [Adiantum capillus-veneris]|nr:hypothetical protein GOP47_0030134 [Adiantum capillus-veneris]